jgi:Rod binding domain-containing protein
MMDIFALSNPGQLHDADGLADIRRTASQDSAAQKLQDVARKFAGVLLQQMFKQAQQNIEQMDTDEEEESEDAGGEQIQSLYWSQMSDLVSEQGGVGLWKSIYQQMAQQVNLPTDAAAGLNEGV